MAEHDAGLLRSHGHDVRPGYARALHSRQQQQPPNLTSRHGARQGGSGGGGGGGDNVLDEKKGASGGKGGNRRPVWILVLAGMLTLLSWWGS
jgi:hypothetical protein